MLTETFSQLKSKFKGDLIVSDFNFFKKDKILIEKRKRHQAYISLNYILSFLTYFDFFSHDTFKIIIESKIFAALLNKKSVTSEFLLLPFFYFNNEFMKILKEYKFDQKQIFQLVSEFNIEKNQQSQKKNFFDQILKKISSKDSLKNQNISYSYDFNFILEKASENGLTRFKTPVITPEILFITLMEEKKMKGSKIIGKFLSNETTWFIFRYKLLKRIHKHESAIRNDVKKNQQLFAYLLKTQLSEFEFNTLLETKSLDLGVSLFRNLIISQLLHLDLLNFLEEETYNSVKVTGRRIYSI